MLSFVSCDVLKPIILFPLSERVCLNELILALDSAILSCFQLFQQVKARSSHEQMSHC